MKDPYILYNSFSLSKKCRNCVFYHTNIRVVSSSYKMTYTFSQCLSQRNSFVINWKYGCRSRCIFSIRNRFPGKTLAAGRIINFFLSFKNKKRFYEFRCIAISKIQTSEPVIDVWILPNFNIHFVNYFKM